MSDQMSRPHNTGIMPHWWIPRPAYDPYNNIWIFDHDKTHQTQRLREHDFMEKLRSRLSTWLLQSPRHSDDLIEVDQAKVTRHNDPATTLRPFFKIQVAFKTPGRQLVQRLCRPILRKHPCKGTSARTFTDDIQICENNRWVFIEDFLDIYYPIPDKVVTLDTMRRWWKANGKTFNWNGLPTELKENVVLFCLHHPRTAGLYCQHLRKFIEHSYRRPFAVTRHGLGIFEVVDKLGDWCHLLRVSRQVRNVTIRLCLMGSDGAAGSKGLCIKMTSYDAFQECLDRLGQYYQVTAANSLPVDQKTTALAECYSQFPKVYPHLQQYATFRHGIRKICLKMSLLSYMRFFKVTVGGFKRYWWTDTDQTTFEVFEQLPLLNEVIFRLPSRPRGARGWRDNPSKGGPALIHHRSPCPRTLYRIIYERIAETMASYENVQLHRFMDHNEKQRFLDLRRSAIQKLKFTNEELEQLYEDDGGGVELEYAGTELSSVASEVRPAEQQVLISMADNEEQRFFPPRCRCEKDCATYSEW